MKHNYYSSLFSMYAQVAGAISVAGKKKNNILMTAFSRVGIKFDNISTGKLYPGEFVFKDIHGLRQKEITSRL